MRISLLEGKSYPFTVCTPFKLFNTYLKESNSNQYVSDLNRRVSCKDIYVIQAGNI